MNPIAFFQVPDPVRNYLKFRLGGKGSGGRAPSIKTGQAGGVGVIQAHIR